MKFIVLVCVLVSTSCYAQSLNNRSAIKVKAGTYITIKQNFINKANGSVTINGELRVKGNVMNYDSNFAFTPSNGRVVLNGALQTIGGSYPVKFPVLEMFNGTKTLEQNIFTGNNLLTNVPVLLLNNSVLKLNSRQLFIQTSNNAGVTRTTGFIESETDSNTGYGSVVWKIGETVNQGYTVPFGQSASGSFLPVTAQVAKAGTGVDGAISLATYATDATQSPNNRPLPTGATNMNDSYGNEYASASVDRFWIVKAENFPSMPTIDMAVTYRNAEWDNSNGSTNNIDEATLQLQAWNGVEWGNFEGSVVVDENQVSTTSNMFRYSVWRVAQNNMAAATAAISAPAPPFSSVAKAMQAKILLYPNPARDKIKVVIPAAFDQRVFVQVLDLSGAVIKSINHTLYGGSNTINLNVADLPAGNYILRAGGMSVPFVKL